MFQALPAYPHEALQKQHLVYWVGVMAAGCTRTGVSIQSWYNQSSSIPSGVCKAPPKDEQVMLETCGDP
jgi:hypothetical protein